MNIVQILPELNTGGVETGVVDLAVRLAKAGHCSIVISNGGELVKQIEADGVRHYSLPVHSKNPVTALKMIPAVAKILRQEKADIVHARSRVPAIIGYYAARRTGCVFVTTCHGYYSKRMLSFSGVMGWGKLVIAISQVIAKHMMDNFGVPYRRIRLIYRGVDLDKFKYRYPEESPKKEFVIGIIGMLSPIKGHTYFLRAVSKAIKSIPRLKVLIVGDAPPEKAKYKQELEDLVRRLGLSRYVEFLGRRSDIPEILSRLDALVLANHLANAALGGTHHPLQEADAGVVHQVVDGGGGDDLALQRVAIEVLRDFAFEIPAGSRVEVIVDPDGNVAAIKKLGGTNP